MATKTIEHRGRVTKARVKKSSICLAMLAHGEDPEMFQRLISELGDRISCYSVVIDEDDDATAAAVAMTCAHLAGKIHRLPWIDDKYGVGHGDYAANRNRMLQLAREAECDYVLWLDPDDPLIGTIPDELTEPVYCVEINAGGTSWVGEQLIHKDADVHWKGMLHEYLVKPGYDSTLLPDCHLDRTSSGSSRTGRIENKAIPLLIELVKEDQNDGHAWFYLAQSFKDIGKKPEAVAAYNQRAHMGGDNEVVFWCLFNVAQLTGNPDDYLQAWNVRPSRVEPLHALAAFYNARGQYVVGRMFAQIGLGIKPTDDAKFVERWVESYGLVAELAHAEYALGDHERAIKRWEYCLSVDDLQPHHRILFQHNIDEAHERGSGSLTTSYDKAFINSPLGPMEGSISEQEMHFLSELVESKPGPIKVAETGFDCGRSAWALLEGNPEATVTSFCLMEFGGEKIVKEIIDEHFPGRHTLVIGDSKETVPAQNEDFDLVFIDGGHDYETAMADLKNFAKPGRMVMFDDIVEASWAQDCVRAWREATAEDGFIDEKLETRDGPHGWSVGVYR